MSGTVTSASSPPPITVRVSQDPAERLRQVQSFWRRNPGHFETNPVHSTMRDLADQVPALRGAVDLIRPTIFGYGEPLIGQVQWQIASERQPRSEWWMRMNERLVGDGMTAEAYQRAGRASEVTSPNLKAWLRYVDLNDQIRATLRMPVDAQYSKPGSIDDTSRPLPNGAFSDAWKGASLLERFKVELWLKPRALKAYWTAHDESIKAAAHESRELLGRMAKEHPLEARFSSAWANSVVVHRIVSPPGTGRWGRALQERLLPGRYPIDGERLSGPQRALLGVLTWFERTFPRE